MLYPFLPGTGFFLAIQKLVFTIYSFQHLFAKTQNFAL
jgi:hypothetical protein